MNLNNDYVTSSELCGGDVESEDGEFHDAKSEFCVSPKNSDNSFRLNETSSSSLSMSSSIPTQDCEDEDATGKQDKEKESKEKEMEENDTASPHFNLDKFESCHDGDELDNSEDDEAVDLSEEELELRRRRLEDALDETELSSRKAKAESLKQTANVQFAATEFSQASATYLEALSICPLRETELRAILHGNRAAALVKTIPHDADNCDAVDDGNDVTKNNTTQPTTTKAASAEAEAALSECSKAIKLNPAYLKVILRRARLFEQLDRLTESLEDFKLALQLDPDNREARQACIALPPRVAEQQEKLKNQMFDQLKQLGNLVLKPFGLSTNNFKVNQDPQSGGYSINFQPSN